MRAPLFSGYPPSPPAAALLLLTATRPRARTQNCKPPRTRGAWKLRCGGEKGCVRLTPSGRTPGPRSCPGGHVLWFRVFPRACLEAVRHKDQRRLWTCRHGVRQLAEGKVRLNTHVQVFPSGPFARADEGQQRPSLREERATGPLLRWARPSPMRAQEWGAPRTPRSMPGIASRCALLSGTSLLAPQGSDSCTSYVWEHRL